MEKKVEKKARTNLTKKNKLIPILTIVSILFYILSLKGCDGTQAYCLVTLSPSFFYLLGIYCLICAIIAIYIIFQIITKQANYLHLFYVIPIYLFLLYFIDNGSDLSHHGAYNKMVFQFLLILCTIIYFLWKLIYWIFKKYKILSISFIILFISLIIRYNKILINNCNTWYDGIDGIRLENNIKEDKCRIVHPKKCFINSLDGVLDVSRILSETCENFRGGEKNELFKFLRIELKNSTDLAFPITTDYSWLNESHFDRFFNNVINGIIDLNDDKVDKKLKENAEVILRFDKNTNYGNISIQVKKNKTLVKERMKKYHDLSKNEKPKYKNILFLYIDAISRPEFLRGMKETIKIINKITSTKKMKLYQMMKYQSFIYFTQQNTNPMFFGESMFNSNGTSILKAFKQKGYITGTSNNICTRELYDIEDDYTEKIDFENFDHENIAMMCDPNFYNPENRFTPYIGPYSIKRRCLYGKDTFEYVLEYGQKFWEAYLNEPKFLRLCFQDAHEGTLEVVKYFDKKLALFLDYFFNKNYLKDTAIYFVSDHGNNMIGAYNVFQVEDYVLEKTLGTWFLLLSESYKFNDTNIIYNQQRYVTPYDIHDTLLDMLQYEKNNKYYSRFGQSIYNKVNGLERNCKTYAQDLLPLWCRCEDF